ncbi:sulfite exporter TauE/SafE family protein [Dietzia sp. 179-F 9C3 NHS]|uniref:sulfite exporter TauE/SafE family protein n=1 Tax=Dietzia sp. 179-F 9C3 NHS TaxID=3374295 RepID=UPI003879454C
MPEALLTTDALGLLVVSAVIGVVIGLTGMGGGALMTPALILVGIPPTAAVANDLVVNAVNKVVGAGVHWRHGKPNLKIAFWLIVGSVPTAYLGAWLVHAIGAEDVQGMLKGHRRDSHRGVDGVLPAGVLRDVRAHPHR